MPEELGFYALSGKSATTRLILPHTAGPVPAGMVPRTRCRRLRRSGGPRACGDGPIDNRDGQFSPGRPRVCGDGPRAQRVASAECQSSSRLRGWSAHGPVHVHGLGVRPRPCGDDPDAKANIDSIDKSPPHPRRWSADARPARRLEAVTPRLRGWSVLGLLFVPLQVVAVAPAEMVRSAALAMVFKLVESAQARWRAVSAPHLVALVRAGARFERGHLVGRSDAHAA